MVYGAEPVFNWILDRLEEWIIAVLIGAATILTFVAVIHRYGASNSAELTRWAGTHGFVVLAGAADWVYRSLAAIDLSWAQELATYMFVWMAKFGAALGVRTGIHVGVDIFVKRLTPAARTAGDRVRSAFAARFSPASSARSARSTSTSSIRMKSRRSSNGRVGSSIYAFRSAPI